ncbi:MAG: DUF1698 domain-containing protein, partial [Thiothrix sp.]
MSALLDARFADAYHDLAATRLASWLDSLPQQVQAAVYEAAHGKRELWLNTLAQLPNLVASSVDFTQAAVRIGQAKDLHAEQASA